jgi:hypothetical protein
VWLLGNRILHGVALPTCGEMELYEQKTCSCIVQANAPQPVPAVGGETGLHRKKPVPAICCNKIKITSALKNSPE